MGKTRLWAVIAAALLALPMGCGGDDGGDGGGGEGEGEGGQVGSSETMAACRALCDAQAEGEGCTEAAKTTCNLFCDAIVPSLDEDCHAKARAAWACTKDTEWECSGDGDLAVSVDQSCNDVQVAFSVCLTAPSGS